MNRTQRIIGQILLWIFLIVGVTQVGNAQYAYEPVLEEGYYLFVGYGADLKMAGWGPYQGKFLQDSTHDYELKGGLETDKLRYTFSWKSHHELNSFVKLTWLKLDYILRDHLLAWEVEGFHQYIGGELSQVSMDNPYYNIKDPYNYIERWKSKVFNPGINAEIGYNIKGTNVNMAIGTSVYRNVQNLKANLNLVRWDVTVSAYLFF